MKMNKWTVTLASFGLVSLASAQVEQPKLVSLGTALSATTISGYVDTSAQWDIGTGNNNNNGNNHVAPFAFNTGGINGKQDGFNLNSADVNISKAIDPSVPWSAGYTVDLLFGPDAPAVTGNSLGAPGSTLGGLGENLRQAYVDLSFPVGNYPDLKVGRFDQLLGFESIDSYKNPNFTRSYGFTLEPTEHTGALLHYKFTDSIDLNAGIANTVTTGAINARGIDGVRAESHKAYLGLLTLTAPKDWGFLAEDAVVVGVSHGPGVSKGERAEDKTHLYAGANLNTPLKDLTLGVAYDAVFNTDGAVFDNTGTYIGYANYGYSTAIAGYVSYKVSEKLRTSFRADYAHGQVLGALNGSSYFDTGTGEFVNNFDKVFALTGTVTYDLWANVLTRLEVRWDHATGDSKPFGELPSKDHSIMVAANMVYKF